MSKFWIIFHAAFAVVMLAAVIANLYYCRKKSSGKPFINKTFHTNIMNAAKANDNFRHVLSTAAHAQVVLMSLTPGENIGKESHDTLDQIFVFVEGTGKAVVNNIEYALNVGDLLYIPAETIHDIINTGKSPLKLFTIYAPPQHKQGLIQKIKPAND